MAPTSHTRQRPGSTDETTPHLLPLRCRRLRRAYARPVQSDVQTPGMSQRKARPRGHLLPWMAWHTAIDREMRFYESVRTGQGYPIFVTTTFVDGDWQPMSERSDTTTDKLTDQSPMLATLRSIRYLSAFVVARKQQAARHAPSVVTRRYSADSAQPLSAARPATIRW